MDPSRRSSLAPNNDLLYRLLIGAKYSEPSRPPWYMARDQISKDCISRRWHCCPVSTLQSRLCIQQAQHRHPPLLQDPLPVGPPRLLPSQKETAVVRPDLACLQMSTSIGPTPGPYVTPPPKRPNPSNDQMAPSDASEKPRASPASLRAIRVCS